MDNVITRIEIDLYSPTSYEVIKAQQGDSLSRIIEIVLLNKGEPYAIPTKNVSIRLEGHRGDGSSFSKSNNCTLNNNVITVVLDNDILFYSGTVEVKVVLYELPDDGTKRILSSIPFRVHVQKNPCDKSSITMGNKSLIDDLIFDFTNLEISINKNIADEIDRATKAENDLDVKKVDKTTVATSSTLGLVKSGTDITVDSSGNVSVKDNSHKHTVSNISDLTATTSELNVLDGITSTTTELNKLHGTTATVDDFNKLHDVTASASELNIMDGVTATTTELNYVDGVTSNIQTQLNSKQPNITGGATTITSSNLTASRALISNSSGKVAVSDVTSTELGYLDGVTSNIQTQLNTKAPLASPTLTGTPKAPTATAGTNTTQIATTAFVTTAVANGIAASDAMIIKGTIGTSGTVTYLPTTYKTGWTYRVVTAGTYAGQVCEIGDLIVALVDRSGSGNLDSDWCVAQTNINGAITGIKSGDAYISTSQSGSVVTITHKDVTRTNTTSTASPSHGGTFTAVKTVTSDAKGHVTGVDTETVTLPTYTALKNPNAISINGKSYDGSSAVNVGTIGAAYGGTGQTSLNASANSLINSLSLGTDAPSDADYYVAQYAGGGTTNTNYYRRPVSALWNYIKSKLATVATSGSYNDLSNKPTIGNGTVTIKQAGTSKGTFTMNQSGNTTIELTDNNTTYGVATQSVNGLESAADKKKLDGIATGAEVNQNAFSNVKVGETTIAADSKTDSLTLAGSNVTITPDATNDKVTIGITKANVTSALGYTPPTTNTTYGVATSSALGLVKSGTDITVDSSGNVSVKDDSHNHVISNVDGLQTALNGKANTSHGNHVPTTQTANNAKFLRNDNTWQTVTPANIGAAASSHGTHVTYGTSASALGTSSAGSASTVSRSDHVHALPALTSCTGTLSVAKGGTGATNAATARTNLGITPANIGALKHAFTNMVDLGFTAKSTVSVKDFLIALRTKIGVNSAQVDISWSTANGATVSDGTDSVLIEGGVIYTSGNGDIISGTWATYTAIYFHQSSSTFYKFATYVSSTAGTYSTSMKKYLSADLITPANIGAAASSHTHKYAGSSSAGGAATTALACTGNSATATNVAWSGVTSKPSYYDAKAIKSITRSGTTFTYTCMDGSTGKFTQQDNNTTYGVVSTSADGLAPKRDGSTTKYLRADGAWAVPPDTNTTYTSLKNPYALTIQGNGTTLTNGTYDGSAAKTVNITPSSIGAAASSHGTHVTYGTSASALGTSSAGSASTVSRSDHVHALPALTSCTGTLTVAKGGTGATTFTSGTALIGNGTGAVTTRSITNMTTKSYINYNTNLMTTNTLAYWNGAYSSGNASNLSYCVKGAFGDACTRGVDTTATSGSTNLITSGAMYTALAGKANSSHGTHVTYSTTKPVMDGTASVGTATTVARSDHKHPTDTSRASTSSVLSTVAQCTASTTSSNIAGASALAELNNSLGSFILERTSETLTTNNNGIIYPSLSVTNTIILSVRTTDGVICLPFVDGGNNAYPSVKCLDRSLNPIVGQSLNFHIMYAKIR